MTDWVARENRAGWTSDGSFISRGSHCRCTKQPAAIVIERPRTVVMGFAIVM